jgi:hypothetical protein
MVAGLMGVMVGGLLVSGGALANEEELLKRIKVLEERIAELESRVPPGDVVTSEKVTETTLGFIGGTEISGLVSASYFYNFNNPDSRKNTGRGFDVRHNEFMANKFVLTLEKPVEYGGIDWAAGYKASLLFGQDAAFTQTDLAMGNSGDLFEGYVEVNVPLCLGLKVTIGKYGTPLGYEASMTEENWNWSGGNQWTLLEPFTHTGIMLSYKWNEEWETKFLVNNGWDNVKDNNDAKSFMGNVAYTPNDKTSVWLTAFGGPEQDNNDSNWRCGVDAAIERKLSKTVTGAVQLDYGQEDGADSNGGSAEWYAAGLWLVCQPSEKWSHVLRADYVNDKDGARTSGAPYRTKFPVNTGMELYSLTLTVNYWPLEELRLSPEVRWDHSTLDSAFDGHEDQVTVGIGAAYFF